jgi:ubiquinone/menaquinone biosynthesis C-methylase UbiE
LPFNDASFDTILFHQVLHYAQTPDYVIAEAARVLAPGGRLIIVDFASHDFEELRIVHAHARLGFADDMIERSFATNGLKLSGIEALEGGKLVVKIWSATRVLAAGQFPNLIESPNLRNPS